MSTRLVCGNQAAHSELTESAAGVFHRDVKMPNFVYDEHDNICMIDFSACKVGPQSCMSHAFIPLHAIGAAISRPTGSEKDRHVHTLIPPDTPQTSP